MSDKEQKESEKQQPAEKPVSLHPLGFEEALSDLLKTSAPNKAREKSDG